MGIKVKVPLPPIFFSLSAFTHATMGNVNGCYNRTVPLTCCHDLMISDSCRYVANQDGRRHAATRRSNEEDPVTPKSNERGQGVPIGIKGTHYEAEKNTN
jgi:hypothetical protein